MENSCKFYHFFLTVGQNNFWYKTRCRLFQSRLNSRVQASGYNGTRAVYQYSNIFFAFFRENGLIIKEPQLENACAKIGSLVNGAMIHCHVSTKPG